MPAAEQIAHLVSFFTAIAWWTLTPTSGLLLDQPGKEDIHRHILVASNKERSLVVAYAPAGGEIRLDPSVAALSGEWCNPRTGERQPVTSTHVDTATYNAPTREDWLLILLRSR